MALHHLPTGADRQLRQRPRQRPLTTLRVTQANGQVPQLTDQLSYEINGLLIDQPALYVKLCLGICYIDAFVEYLRKDSAKWREVIKAANVKIE